MARTVAVCSVSALLLLMPGCGSDASPSCDAEAAEDAVALSKQDAVRLAETSDNEAVALAEVEGEVAGHSEGDQWYVVAVGMEDGTAPVFAIALNSVVMDGSTEPQGRSALNEAAELTGEAVQLDVMEALSALTPIALDCLAELTGSTAVPPTEPPLETTTSTASTTTTTTTSTTTTTAPPPPANPPTMSLAEFNEIQSGMSYDQVVAIVGGPGQLLSQTDMAGYSTVIYMWNGAGGLGANANIMFQSGALISKAQFGLS